MKISKTRLQQIINEEINDIIRENPDMLSEFDWQSAAGKAAGAIKSLFGGDDDESEEQGVTDPSGLAKPGNWERYALEKVVAGDGSKKYDDVLPLDGGTVGIAHWAASGLKGLAAAHSDFPSHPNIKDCQHVPGNDKIKGDATAENPGCYYNPGTTDEHPWVGKVKSWLKANKEAQFKYWKTTKAAYGNRAITKCTNWTTKRHAAIAAGIANSSPVEAKAAIAACTDPETAMSNYAGKSDHRARRLARLNTAYPTTVAEADMSRDAIKKRLLIEAMLEDE